MKSQRLGGVRRFGFVTIAAALAMALGCSKNQTASEACATYKDSDACSACCTKNGANGFKYVTGSACECIGGGSAAAPPAPGKTTLAARFDGSYKSTWGPTVFTQDGSHVSAKYPGGTMECQAAGMALDCEWHEGAQTGHAKLAKQPDRSIQGTWGNGPSATNGGAWTFTP